MKSSNTGKCVAFLGCLNCYVNVWSVDKNVQPENSYLRFSPPLVHLLMFPGFRTITLTFLSTRSAIMLGVIN